MCAGKYIQFLCNLFSFLPKNFYKSNHFEIFQEMDYLCCYLKKTMINLMSIACNSCDELVPQAFISYEWSSTRKCSKF